VNAFVSTLLLMHSVDLAMNACGGALSSLSLGYVTGGVIVPKLCSAQGGQRAR
jgi:hypothetical protein